MPMLQGKRVRITISMRKEWKSHDRGTQVQPQVVEKIDDSDLKLGILRAPSQLGTLALRALQRKHHLLFPDYRAWKNTPGECRS